MKTRSEWKISGLRVDQQETFDRKCTIEYSFGGDTNKKWLKSKSVSFRTVMVSAVKYSGEAQIAFKKE